MRQSALNAAMQIGINIDSGTDSELGKLIHETVVSIVDCTYRLQEHTIP